MTSSLRVFVDSDVVISSLISKSGAGYLLVNNKNIELFVSNISLKELEVVAGRLRIDERKLKNFIKDRFNIVQLKVNISILKNKYKEYISDPNDAHIVAGAVKAKVRFLVSYNIRHFKIDKVKQDFNIIVLTPAYLLQYLRGLS